MHFRISSSLSFQRKTKRHVFLLLFVLTPVYLNWPSYATGKCYRSPRQLISTMKHWWLYITIHSLTIFKWKTRNLRLNLIYLSFFVQYTCFNFISLHQSHKVNDVMLDLFVKLLVHTGIQSRQLPSALEACWCHITYITWLDWERVVFKSQFYTRYITPYRNYELSVQVCI